MQEAFGWSFEQDVYFGGYPGAADLISDEQRWRDYIRNSLVETSISKDILMLTRVDKPALLRHLFELGSAHSGQILSFNKMLGQLLDAGNTTTLAGYLTLLTDAGLLGGLEKYSGSKINQRSSSPKFQVFNNALFTTQLHQSFETARISPDIWGRLVESAIGTHLINNKIKGNYNLYYWRESNSEVDFVLEKGGKTVALEVKSGRAQKNAGMNVFIKKYPQAKPLLTGKSGIPCDVFLKINPEELF
jgi:predicted AAA+ superfamily ATPase